MNMIQYMVVVGNGKRRHREIWGSIETCQSVIRAYIKKYNIGGVYGYGFGDEGYVYKRDMRKSMKFEKIGRISYNGRFWAD